MKFIKFQVIMLAACALFVASCSSKQKGGKSAKGSSSSYVGGKGSGTKPTAENPGDYSRTTGVAYNQKGTYEVSKDFKGQPTGPNLVFIEGGRFTLGALEEDIMNKRDNRERTVTVQSFYMDETEIANIQYLEYLHAVKRDSSQEAYEAALPDTTVWADPLAFNDSYVENYLRYPGFRFFPVVGVSWEQANDFADWRTTVVNNEMVKKYMSGNAKGKDKKVSKTKSKDGKKVAGAESAAPSAKAETPLTASNASSLIEKGVTLPRYRLPTEAEWEYAAKAMIGTQDADENQSGQRIYPWDGSSMRNRDGKQKGLMLANFKRGRGDYGGLAGKSNDAAIITANVYTYEPNDFGLYNMAGNVNEWVMDTYRPMSYEDFNDLNPIRRNEYLDEEKNYDSKNSNSSVTNKSRVYKGGSWNDVAYWLAPGTRRHMDKDSANSTIGFRCAMIRAGSNK
jgi:formylglycine-generating enzyme